MTIPHRRTSRSTCATSPRSRRPLRGRVRAARPRAATVAAAERRSAIDVEVDAVRRRFRVATCAATASSCTARSARAELLEVPRFAAARREEIVGGCLAPMPGIVRAVHVGRRAITSRRVQVLVILEAMKMEHELIAHARRRGARGARRGRADGRSRTRCWWSSTPTMTGATRGEGLRCGRDSNPSTRSAAAPRGSRSTHPQTRNALSARADR